MAEHVALPPPRTLYTQLRECASSQARAAAVLGFLRDCTGSEAGFLFLARPDGLSLAASTGGSQPATDLVAEVRRSWDRELDRQPDETKTLELSSIEALRNTGQQSPFWSGASTELFERRLLSMYRSGSWIPVGLVMLRAREGTLVPIRQVHIEALCSALLDSGDVSESTLPPQPRRA